MSPEVYRAASELLDQALSEAPEKAQDWLEGNSTADPAAKLEALRLLGLHQAASNTFLTSPIERVRTPWKPEQLGEGTYLAKRYRVIRLLGEGGMGEVYLVQDEELHQQVALKTLRAHLAQDSVSLERFRREVLLLREINHPNVIRIFDFGRADDLYFYTMDYLDGDTLAARIRKQGALGAGAVRALAADLMAALEVIHSHGIVHRDLKPANIFLTLDQRAVVMDFGIATTDGQTALTETNSVLGSLDYMSPEQLEGHAVTFRSDFYALGLVLVEALSGKLAYSGTSPVARAFRRLNEPKSVVLPPGSLGRGIEACLAKNPAQRPDSVEALRRILAGEWRLHWRRILAVAAALLVAILLWQNRPVEKQRNPALDQHLKLAAQFASRRTAVDLQNARQEYEAAIQLDGNNVEAWTGLAETFSTIANFGYDEARPTLAKAAEAAKRALSLAPNSGVAQSVQAYIVSLDFNGWREADPLFRRALELDASQSRTYLWFGAFLTKLGRFQEALTQLQLGLAIDPGSMPLNQQLATTYAYSRNYPAAIQASEALIRLHPREPSAHLALCGNLLFGEQYKRAHEACAEALRLDAGPISKAMFASVLAAEGQTAQARSLALEAEPKLRNVAILADLYHRLGEDERAVQLVEKAFLTGESTLQYLAYSPRFDGLRQYPKVQVLQRKLGFDPAVSPQPPISTR